MTCCRALHNVILLPILSSPAILPMKTTVEISDSLLREARKLARREGMTLRALVEQGLRCMLTEKKPAFRLRDASFGGRGLRSELRDAGWDQLRDMIYEGRGGLDTDRKA